MEMNFCRRCGTSLKNIENHIYKCQKGHTLYANSVPTAGILLINDANELLIAIRSIDPSKGGQDIPGGFLDGAETLEHAIIRELAEELDIQPGDYSIPEYLCSGLDDYDFGGETVPVMCAYFWARLKSDIVLTPKDDVASIKFIPLASTESTDFVFDSIHTATHQLRQLLL